MRPLASQPLELLPEQLPLSKEKKAAFFLWRLQSFVWSQQRGVSSIFSPQLSQIFEAPLAPVFAVMLLFLKELKRASSTPAVEPFLAFSL